MIKFGFVLYPYFGLKTISCVIKICTKNYSEFKIRYKIGQTYYSSILNGIHLNIGSFKIPVFKLNHFRILKLDSFDLILFFWLKCTFNLKSDNQNLYTKSSYLKLLFKVTKNSYAKVQPKQG